MVQQVEHSAQHGLAKLVSGCRSNIGTGSFTATEVIHLLLLSLLRFAPQILHIFEEFHCTAYATPQPFCLMDMVQGIMCTEVLQPLKKFKL